MPIDVFFRKPKDFQPMESYALSLCRGHVLDIGAGAGAHALYLQSKHFKVTALEISSTAVEIMKKRGLKSVVQADIFSFDEAKYDTLLLMMNGIGIAGSIEGLNKLLVKLKALLNPGGTIIFDSSDISYLYQDHPLPIAKYFGEISYRYVYKSQKGPWFDWLYIDQQKMNEIAINNGLTLEVLCEDDSDQYLALLRLEN
jgi:2-polyprenyl-3-methyl-5-hydroxy-6-metoxy-1,4-benzoquinol methylase